MTGKALALRHVDLNHEVAFREVREFLLRPNHDDVERICRDICLIGVTQVIHLKLLAVMVLVV